MTFAFLSHHAPLVRDYTELAPPPPAPVPAPPPSPTPPTTPPAFTLTEVREVDATISTLISPAKTLATITTAIEDVLVVASATVAGCTVQLVGSPPTACTLEGTPTTAGDTRLNLTYLTDDDDRLVLGGSTHDIRIVDPAAVFTPSGCAGLPGRVGTPIAATTLTTATLANNLDVTAHVSGMVPGLTVAWAWTRSGSSSGTLSISGTPTEAIATTLSVEYRDGDRVIGSTTHPVNIVGASSAIPSAPAPPPCAAGPAPAPAPSPAPAPGTPPVALADPLIASVLLLNPMSSGAQDLTGSAAPFAATYPSQIGPNLTGTGLLERGGAYFERTMGARATVPDAWDISNAAFCVEAVVGIDWVATRTFPPSRATKAPYSPILTYIDGDGALVWSLGILSRRVAHDGDYRWSPHLVMWRRTASGFVTYAESTVAAAINASPFGGFAHVAAACNDTNVCVWWKGAATNRTGTAFNRVARNGGKVHVAGSGGSGSVIEFALGLWSEVRPLHQSIVKDIRITSALRYTPGTDLTTAQMVTPWANY